MKRQVRRMIMVQVLLVGSIIAVLSSCTSDYEKRVNEELASGERYDSLFLGISFGMTSKEFYQHCWELNNEGLLVEGNGNSTVQYNIDDFKQPAELNFYPDFHEDKIFQMPTTFSYKAYAPWNKALSADSLQLEVLAMMQKWYGEDFIKVESKDRGTAYVRVDGNRRITIYKPDETDIHVLFTDLSVENVLKTMKN